MPFFNNLYTAQGRAAISNEYKLLKMEERQNCIFAFPS